MADGAQVSTRRFSAFISYTHRDVAAAKRLQHQLETYRLPARVALSAAPDSLRGRRLKPVFRDISDLSAAHDLTEAIREALAQSDNLIVVCSPRSAKSEWVGREIDYFRALHGDRGIRAALVDGEPVEALHPELRKRRSGEPVEPLAADFTNAGPGKRLSLLKLVAGVTGAPLDELVQRDAQRRRRVAVAAGASGFIALTLFGILSWATMSAQEVATQQRQRTEKITTALATEIRHDLKKRGQVAALSKINRALIESYDTIDPSNRPLQIKRAIDILSAGENEESAGNTDAAVALINLGYSITDRLYRKDPRDPEGIYAHAQSAYYIGYINWRLGLVPRADQGFRQYLALAYDLPQTKTDWILERGYAETNIGMLLLRHSGNLNAAEGHFLTALETYRQVAKRTPDRTDVQVQIADSYAWLGDISRLRGDFRNALKLREMQRAIIDREIARDGQDLDLRSLVLGNELGIARIEAAQQRTQRAKARLRAASLAADELARTAPDHKGIGKNRRMIRLFEAKYSLPASPSATDIEAYKRSVGTCEPSTGHDDYAEIGQFCSILLARVDQHRKPPSSGARNSDTQADRYTRRWGIDLKSEAAWALRSKA